MYKILYSLTNLWDSFNIHVKASLVGITLVGTGTFILYLGLWFIENFPSIFFIIVVCAIAYCFGRVIVEDARP